MMDEVDEETCHICGDINENCRCVYCDECNVKVSDFDITQIQCIGLETIHLCIDCNSCCVCEYVGDNNNDYCSRCELRICSDCVKELGDDHELVCTRCKKKVQQSWMTMFCLVKLKLFKDSVIRKMYAPPNGIGYVRSMVNLGTFKESRIVEIKHDLFMKYLHRKMSIIKENLGSLLNKRNEIQKLINQKTHCKMPYCVKKNLCGGFCVKHCLAFKSECTNHCNICKCFLGKYNRCGACSRHCDDEQCGHVIMKGNSRKTKRMRLRYFKKLSN